MISPHIQLFYLTVKHRSSRRIVQDTLCGIRKFQNILPWIPGWDGNVSIPSIIKPKSLWSGKQFLSMVIPHGINIQRARIQSPRIPSLVMAY